MKNHLEFLATYVNNVISEKNLAETILKDKQAKLNAFGAWFTEQPETVLNDVLGEYQSYLATKFEDDQSSLEDHLSEVEAFLRWFATHDETPVVPSNPHDYVVGIGASAGGLEALERFFGSELVNPDLTYVVIQHLSPDFKSMMPEILARVTNLPIHSIEDGMTIEPGHIYLNTPRSDVRINGKVFAQEAQPDDLALHLPINTFFKSLAFAKKDKAVGIILSGTGRDGSAGVSDIHNQGGLVLTQDSESAVYTSMPDSAAIQGPAHLVLNPNDMPQVINTYIETQVLPEQVNLFDTTGMTVENAFSYLMSLLQRTFGIDFTVYKNATLVRRVDRRMNLGNYVSLEHYVSKLQEDPRELDALYRDMLVDVTSFFRDEEAFKLLEEKVIPQIVSQKEDGDALRIWTAACASGEETYSLAILFQEEINRQGKLLDFKVFATDAHKESILRASMGVFTSAKLENVPDDFKEKYFEQDGDDCKIIKALRQKIIFAPHNLLSDGNFSSLDLVSCRNMLIYLEPEAQATVLTQFSNGLNKEGILFLGSSEHLGSLRDYFEIVSEKWRIYKKNRNLPISQGFPSRIPANITSPTRVPRPKAHAQQGWERDLLKTLVENGFVVDAQGQLVEIFGSAKNYLNFRAGRVNLNLSTVLDEPLATTVKSGLYKVQKSGEPLALVGVRVSGEKDDYVNLRFVPFTFSKSDAGKTYYLVQLSPSTLQMNEGASEKTSEVQRIDADRMVGLERELEFTRESLQSTLEEVETTNEELQSTNEELIASNEELQSTNEELSSVNEELITVNNEYQAQNKRLNQTNNDLENLMRNTETLAIFLGTNLRIRMITPSAYHVFELLESDIGRPIHHFAHFLSFGDNAIEDLCEAALQGERTNLTISLRDERELELSVLPYMTSTEQIDGVVLRFFDATELIEDTKAPLQEKIKLIERLSEIAPDALFIHNVEENYSIYSIHSKTTAEQLGYSSEEWRPKEKGFLLSKVHPEDVDKVYEFRQALEQSPDGTRKQFNFRFQHKKGHWLWFQTNGIVAERNPDGSLKTVMGYQRSIENQKNLERYSEYSSVLFELSQDCLKIIDENGTITEMSPNGCRLMEIDDFATIKGKAWSSLWPEPSQVEAALAEASEKGFSRFEAFCPTAKGTPKWWDVQVMRTVHPNSDQIGFLSSSRDITKFKQLEETYKAKAQLEERLEFLERLHEGSPSIMYIYDVSEDKNIYATGDVLDMLGYSREELQAFGPGVLAKLMHPTDLALLAAHQKNLNDAEGKQHIFDYRLKHQQGHWLHLRSIDSVFERDEQSKVKRILGHVINLDELRNDVGEAKEDAAAN